MNGEIACRGLSICCCRGWLRIWQRFRLNKNLKYHCSQIIANLPVLLCPGFIAYFQEDPVPLLEDLSCTLRLVGGIPASPAENASVRVSNHLKSLSSMR